MTSGGRWPANVILSPEMAEVLDGQSGTSKSPSGPVTQGKRRNDSGWDRPVNDRHDGQGVGYGDSGGASRFFLQTGYEQWELEWILANGLRPCGMEDG